jgi:ArsR family metal-binding transcriptional regulator
VLLKSYRKEIFRPACNPNFQSLHCVAHLDQDISEVLPYLNTTLGGFEYFKDPPALSIKLHGKLITLHPQKIAVNALKDEVEAEKIIEWLKGEINKAWDKRAEIEPCYEGSPKPNLLEILKVLPKTNCQECGQPTCMVFSSLVAAGVKGADDCPALDDKGRKGLEEYLRQFRFYES